MSRKIRTKKDPDVTRFQPLIDEALKAFGTHMRYAMDMSSRAVTVENKRAKFAAKKVEKLNGGVDD